MSNNTERLTEIPTGPVVAVYTNGVVDWPAVYINNLDCSKYLDLVENLIADQQKKDRSIETKTAQTLDQLRMLLKSAIINDPTHDRKRVVGIQCKNI